MITSGRQLAAARVLAGLDQSQLATLADIHRNSVSRWEAQGAIPTGRERPFAVGQILKGLALTGVTVSSDGATGIRSGRC